MRKIIILGIIGQWVGLLCSLAGIFLILSLAPEVWTFYISAGSVAWGIGTKLKYYTSIKLAEKERGKKVSVDDLLSQHNIVPYLKDNDDMERSN